MVNAGRAEEEKENPKNIKESVSAPKKEKKIKPAGVSEEVLKKSRKYIGGHQSIVDGLYLVFRRNNIINGHAIGMFLNNARTYKAKKYTHQQINRFLSVSSRCEHILPHASYIINLGQTEENKSKLSYELFVDEMKKCESLKISYLNIHPGNNVTHLPIKKACEMIAKKINNAHKETKSVCVVLETMSGRGTEMCSNFEEIAMVINSIEDKSRIGVCLDTCHVFSAGYDIRTKESFAKVMQDFDNIIGLKYLKAMHLNDSKHDLGSKKDRHESIGKGMIGLEAFSYIMNSPIFCDMPLILETPKDSSYAEEVSLLYSLFES